VAYFTSCRLVRPALPPNGARALAAIIGKTPTLKTVQIHFAKARFYNGYLPPSYTQALARGFSDPACTVESLDIIGAKLRRDCIKTAFVGGINQCKTLKRLSFVKCEELQQVLEGILAMLAPNSTPLSLSVTELNLHKNDLRHGFVDLVHLMANSTVITSLDISDIHQSTIEGTQVQHFHGYRR